MVGRSGIEERSTRDSRDSIGPQGVAGRRAGKPRGPGPRSGSVSTRLPRYRPWNATSVSASSLNSPPLGYDRIFSSRMKLGYPSTGILVSEPRCSVTSSFGDGGRQLQLDPGRQTCLSHAPNRLPLMRTEARSLTSRGAAIAIACCSDWISGARISTSTHRWNRSWVGVTLYDPYPYGPSQNLGQRKFHFARQERK